MYHFEVSWGESPDLATVKPAPFESYVGFPWGVKESEDPDVKSMVTDLPSAVSAGQLPVIYRQQCSFDSIIFKGLPDVSGLHCE